MVYSEVLFYLFDFVAADISFLRPLKKLTKLYLSNNNLVRVGEHDFSTLNSLKLLALDNNQIEEVSDFFLASFTEAFDMIIFGFY